MMYSDKMDFIDESLRFLEKIEEAATRYAANPTAMNKKLASSAFEQYERFLEVAPEWIGEFQPPGSVKIYRNMIASMDEMRRVGSC